MPNYELFTVDLNNNFISLIVNISLNDLIHKARLLKDEDKNFVKMAFVCDLTEEDKKFLKENNFLLKDIVNDDSTR